MGVFAGSRLLIILPLKFEAVQQSSPLLKHMDQYSDLVIQHTNTELCSVPHGLLPINNAAY